MTDKNNAAFYYSVNMLRALLAMKLITEEECKKNYSVKRRALRGGNITRTVC